MTNTTQFPQSNNSTNKVILESTGDDEEIDIGIIIGVISLVILTVAVILIIVYFSNLKKKMKAAAQNIIRNESTASNLGVVNSIYDESADQSSTNLYANGKHRDSVINMFGIEEAQTELEADKEKTKIDDNALDSFLNTIENSSMTCKEHILHNNLIEKVRQGTITEKDAKNDPILFDLLKKIENGSLTGSPDLLEMCKCDGNQITTESLRDNTEKYQNMNEKHQKNNESRDAKIKNEDIDAKSNISFVRTISEIENSEASNGEKHKSYFKASKKHKAHVY